MYQQSMFSVKIASYCMGNMINIGLHNDSILLNDEQIDAHTQMSIIPQICTARFPK